MPISSLSILCCRYLKPSSSSQKSRFDSLCDRFIVMKSVRARTRCFPLDDGDLHVLDLDADQQEVDLADNHVFQVVPGVKVVKHFSSGRGQIN
jgi:hypothetical protein